MLVPEPSGAGPGNLRSWGRLHRAPLLRRTLQGSHSVLLTCFLSQLETGSTCLRAEAGVAERGDILRRPGPRGPGAPRCAGAGRGDAPAPRWLERKRRPLPRFLSGHCRLAASRLQSPLAPASEPSPSRPGCLRTPGAAHLPWGPEVGGCTSRPAADFALPAESLPGRGRRPRALGGRLCGR